MAKHLDYFPRLATDRLSSIVTTEWSSCMVQTSLLREPLEPWARREAGAYWEPSIARRMPLHASGEPLRWFRRRREDRLKGPLPRGVRYRSGPVVTGGGLETLARPFGPI
jgi:hypothetical protein